MKKKKLSMNDASTRLHFPTIEFGVEPFFVAFISFSNLKPKKGGRVLNF